MQKLLKVNKRVLLLGAIAVIQLIAWVFHPPFQKTQSITVTGIEKHERGSGFRVEKYKTIIYSYKNSTGELLEGDIFGFSKNLPYVEVGDKIDYIVYTPLSEGGELNLFDSGTFLILLFGTYFLLVFLVEKFMSKVFHKELEENSADAIVFGILVILIFVGAYG